MSKSKLIRLAACLIPAIVIWLLPLSMFGEHFAVTEQRMLAIFVMTALMWILEPVPAWVTSTLAILLMLLTISSGGIGSMVSGIDNSHLASYKDILGSYADPIIILFLGGFVMAQASSECGLDKDLAAVILKPFGRNSNLLLLGILLVTAVLSMFVSNTAAAAMLMPIMVVVGTDIEHNLTDIGGVMVLLLGVGLAASYAMSLPISTPPNSIAYATGKVTTKQMALVGVIVGIFSLALTYLLLFTAGEKIL